MLCSQWVSLWPLLHSLLCFWQRLRLRLCLQCRPLCAPWPLQMQWPGCTGQAAPAAPGAALCTLPAELPGQTAPWPCRGLWEWTSAGGLQALALSLELPALWLLWLLQRLLQRLLLLLLQEAALLPALPPSLAAAP